MGGYYVYSYNDVMWLCVCVLVEGGTSDNECGHQLFSLKISNRHSCIKKNCISYSHERVYIFYLEVDVTTSRETGSFESFTTRFYSTHTVHQLCTFMENNLQKLKIKLHFIPTFFFSNYNSSFSSHIITNSYYDFCHIWWTWDVRYLLCKWEYFVVYR